MKYLNLLRVMPLAFILTVLISACSTQDVYEPDPIDPEKPEEPTPSTDIDWQTFTKTTLSVSVNDEYSGKFYYTVEAYVNNPAVEENAKLIAGSGQKTNKSVAYNREITLPAGLETLYVMITDPYLRKRVYAVAVQEGTISLQIGEDNVPVTRSGAANSLRADDTPNIDFTYDENAIALSGSAAAKVESGKAYIVKKGDTFSGKLTLAGTGGYKLYVEGTLVWNTGNKTSIQTGAEIYVLTGGVLQVNASGTETSTIGTAMVAIQTGGTLKDTANKLLKLTDDSKLINYGSVEVKNLSLSAASQLFNHGVMELGTLKTSDITNPITNTHTLKVDAGTLTNCTIANTCMISFETLAVNGVTIDLGVAAYLYAGNATKVGGMTLNMDDSSIWDGERIVFDGAANKVTGIGTGYALFRVKDIVCYKSKVVTYSGTVEIEKETHTADASKYVLNGSATFANGKATVEIQPSDCNNNTGNYNPGEGEGDVTDTYQEEETLPYTYMFEDNWPAQGDYDMNDLVVSVELRNATRGDKTTSTQVIATLYAVGGTKKLGLGFQLDGISASAVSDGEAGQKYAVYSLFEDAHATLGGSSGTPLNTYKVDYEPQVVEKEIVYTTPISGVINTSNFNLFLVLGSFDQEKRDEVHLPGFFGTNKATTSEKSTADYIDPDGWMWGLTIPQTDFATYPKEGVRIDEAYEGFDTWVSGKDTPDWYFYPIEEQVISFAE